MKKIAVIAALLLAAGVALSGCSTIADPDQVGLYYLEGNSDGYKFDKCIEPGETGDAEWNNSVVYLPTSLRTWNIAADGGDSNKPITVSTKPEENQPSGVQVNVWPTTNFFLNTYCGSDGALLKDFWEKIGRRYDAEDPDGWRNMLVQTFVPVMEKVIQDVVRSYSADALVGNINGVRAEAQAKIATQFTAELKRLVGGSYFCGPSYDRRKPDCPDIEITIKDVDYADPGIQEARNAKQKAIEMAAATVAEAQGKVDAAGKLNDLYKNDAWMKLQLAQLQLEAIKACSDKCTIIIGSSGNIILNGSK